MTEEIEALKKKKQEERDAKIKAQTRKLTPEEIEAAQALKKKAEEAKDDKLKDEKKKKVEELEVQDVIKTKKHAMQI